MPQFAANLSMLYAELDFLDRFEAAAKDGFKAVEYLFPYAYDSAELAARLKANGLQQVLFNAPPGDWEHGERGTACLPGREQDFQAGITRALAYAADQLGSGKWCEGASITLADLALVSALIYLDLRQADRDWRGAHPNLAAWFVRISERASVRTALAE